MTPADELPAGAIRPLVRRLTGAGDPLALYEAVTATDRSDTFLLESGDRATRTGALSLIGVRAAVRFRAGPDRIAVTALSPNGEAALDWLAALAPGGSRTGTEWTVPVPVGAAIEDERTRFRAPSPLDLLRRLVFGPTLTARPNPWCHLAAGTLGYDAIDWFERLPAGRPDPLDEPIIEVWIPDQLIVVDHVRASTTVVTTVWGGPGSSRRHHDASRALESLVAAVAADPRAERPPRPASFEAGPEPDVDQDDASYQATVTALQERIRAGEVYQIVPSRTFRVPCADSLAAYAALRRANPSPYLFYLASTDRVRFGASPETFLRIDGATRRASLLPIAGTAPRGLGPDGTIDPDTDTRIEVTLRLDPKELAEHLMLADLARNDLARIGVPGTRVVSRLLEVERFSRVMHLVSEVTATVAPGIDALEALATVMPIGTLVGAPKVRAAALLREVEPSRRGGYGGAVGYLRSDGTLETAIVIRAAVVVDGQASVRAGAGVVLDSDPAREADETRRKAAAVLDAIRDAEVPAHV